MSARLLLANQLRTITEVEWTVISGDEPEGVPEGVRAEVIPMRRELALSDAIAFLRLVRHLRRRRFDFVQTHTPKASLLGLPAARLSRTPSLYTVHGAMYFRGNSRRANLLGWFFEWWCCTWAKHVLVQSQEDAASLPKARICPAKKLRYLGNGIRLERFAEAVDPARSTDRPAVLMISRLVAEKGCRDFLAVARALAGQADFIHVGPTEHDQRDALSDAELQAAARNGVTFVGAVDDVRPWLAAAEVVVLPSYREGIPRAAMEAAACGLPVVAYDIRGVREVIESATGLLVPRGDVEGLAGVVRALLNDPARRRELGKSCRTHVLTRFSEDSVIARLRDIYSESLDVRKVAAT